MLGAWDRLEERALLATPPVSLISENLMNNGALVGALFPSISADGRYVAFESGSFEGFTTPAPSDLVSGLTVQNDAPNVYLRDLSTGTTICLSLDYQTGTTGNDDSRYPIISANGNTVVFLSNATDLLPIDNSGNNPNDNQNVFVWIRTPGTSTGTLSLVTVNYQGTGPANDPDPQEFGTAENIAVSANGDYIAYDSKATNLVPNENDINYIPNVYVYDVLTKKNILVSAADAGGGIGNSSSNNPVISADGSTVAFDSLASNLDPNHSSFETFSNYQVYASALNYTSDTVASTKLVSVDVTGTTGGNGTSIFPSLSDNGQVIAFQSSSTNLVSTPNGGSFNDVYVRNMGSGVTQLVSINDMGTATGDNSSFDPQMSGDGNHVLFFSLADNLTPNIANFGTGVTDENVFERNLTTGATQLVSTDHQGQYNGDNESTLANQTFTNVSQQSSGQISDNGQYVVFYSIASDLVPNYQWMNGGPPYGFDVYQRDTVNGIKTLLSHQDGSDTIGGTGESGTVVMTPDGASIAFQSALFQGTDNLVPSDSDGQTQLYDEDFGPAVTTMAATSIASTGAALNASVNPDGSATTYSFVYGTDPTLSSGTTTTTGQSAGSGITAEIETATLSGLMPETKYYFYVQASNVRDPVAGAILSFTTSAVSVSPPAATTSDATSITSTGATLNASINPEGSATTFSFTYGTSPTLSGGTITTTSQSAGSGTSAQPESTSISGLAPYTTYYFEVQASNAGGPASGGILPFTTSAAAANPPAATTDAATSISSTGATLNATINPEGSATNFSFTYGTSPTLSSGTTTTTAQSAGSGTSAQPESTVISGLAPDTTYYFEVQASNAGGPASGGILPFSTSAAGTATPPAVTTVAATSITAIGATVGASINPEGSATSYSFVYGTDPTLNSGTTTTALSAGSGASAVPETAALSGLAPGTTYYFEARASNTGGTTVGTILNFTTLAVLQFSSTQFTANVTDGSGQVVVTRTGDLSGTLTVVLSSPGGHEVAALMETVTLGPNVSSEPVSIAIANDGQPGEGNTVIPLSLSSPGTGATLGATTSASLVIVNTNNPPPVTITSLAHPTIKVGSGKKAKKQVVLQLQFSGPVNGAGNLGAYVLESGKTKKGKTTYTKPVPLTSSVYDYPGAPPNTVTLFVRNKLNLSLPEQLTANAGLITDSYGRHLSHNFVITFSNKGVMIQ
jgi:hypothetical protein